MSVSEIRKELHGYIDVVDERFLAAVHVMMRNYIKNDMSIVAYTAEGEPLTKSEFIEKIRNSYEAAKGGHVITNEDFLKEINTWK